MKKLFVLAVIGLALLAWPAAANAKPAHKPKAKPAATADATAAKPATPATPPTPLPRKPGFWERVWSGTKTGSKKIWSATSRTVAHPFGAKSKGGEAGWRNLAMNVSVDPATLKASDNHALKVKVSVANHSKEAVQLEFPSAQRVAILLLDDAGKVHTRAADVQKGDPDQSLLIVNPDERLEYTGTLSTQGLAAGQSYTVEAIFPDFPELHSRHPVGAGH